MNSLPHPEVPALLRASKDAPRVKALRGSQKLAPQGEDIEMGFEK
jgi:hypothetical protein